MLRLVSFRQLAHCALRASYKGPRKSSRRFDRMSCSTTFLIAPEARFHGSKLTDELSFGSNSRLPLYKSRDRAEADQLRNILVRKYPELVRNNEGQWPCSLSCRNECFASRRERVWGHARRSEVVVDKRMCPSCPDILPKVGLEIGNPMVTFIGPRGQVRTMQDGKWLD